MFGAPIGTRTPDLLLRRQLLYPAELLARTCSAVKAEPMERVMGIEPTRPAWKAGILAIELHPRFHGEFYFSISLAVRQAFLYLRFDVI